MAKLPYEIMQLAPTSSLADSIKFLSEYDTLKKDWQSVAAVTSNTQNLRPSLAYKRETSEFTTFMGCHGDVHTIQELAWKKVTQSFPPALKLLLPILNITRMPTDAQLRQLDEAWLSATP